MEPIHLAVSTVSFLAMCYCLYGLRKLMLAESSKETPPTSPLPSRVFSPLDDEVIDSVAEKIIEHYEIRKAYAGLDTTLFAFASSSAWILREVLGNYMEKMGVEEIELRGRKFVLDNGAAYILIVSANDAHPSALG